jgi:uncharacterized protein
VTLLLERLTRLEAVARARGRDADPAHDFLHIRRVADNARRIAASEGADLDIVLPAVLLHELFNYPKDHPDSALSGEVCAAEAATVLSDEGFSPRQTAAICECIRVHSFSRGIVPETLEAEVLQDADRLDALGAVGIARCFATGTAMRRPFYDGTDPFCRRREPDDKEYTLDHFYRKLLRLSETLHTRTAQAIAAERTTFLQTFLAQLEREIGVGEEARHTG